MNDILHAVIMRFGIGVLDEHWLDYRLKLFEATMYPSLRAQDCDYQLVVIIDDALQGPIFDKLASLLSKINRCEIIRIKSYLNLSKEINEYLDMKKLNQKYSVVITTRIDDDDMISVGTFKAIQKITSTIKNIDLIPSIIAPRGGFVWFPELELSFRRDEYGESQAISLAIDVSKRTHIFNYMHKNLLDEARKRGWSYIQIPASVCMRAYTIHKYDQGRYEERVAVYRSRLDRNLGLQCIFDNFAVDRRALSRWLETQSSVEPIAGSVKDRIISIEESIMDKKKEMKGVVVAEEVSAIRSQIQELISEKENIIKTMTKRLD